MSFKIPKKIWLEHLGDETIGVIRLSSIIFGFTIISFLLFEQFKTGIISNSINISLFVAIELALLLVILFFGQRFRRRLPRKRWVASGIIFSLLLFLSVLIFADKLNYTTLIMALVAGVVTYFVWYSYVYDN